MKRKKEEVFMKVKVSRKLYFPFYFMILFLGALLIYLYYKGYEINMLMLVIYGIFVFAVFNITETHRMSSSYSITPDDLTCRFGIFSKKVVKLDYLAISNLGVEQNFWQWMLDYGDIDVRLFSKENSVTLKNINHPSRFVKELERIMQEKRK